MRRSDAHSIKTAHVPRPVAEAAHAGSPTASQTMKIDLMEIMYLGLLHLQTRIYQKQRVRTCDDPTRACIKTYPGAATCQTSGSSAGVCYLQAEP